MFHINSPVMQFLSKAVDMLWLNILTVLCSIPILTVGAAQAGLYYAVGRLQNDEGTVTRDFFAGFRSNFRKATALWLLWLAGLLLIVFAVQFYTGQPGLDGTLMIGVWCLVFAGGFLWALSFSWLSPLQVSFENTVRRTAENAFRFAMGFTKYALGMAFMNLAPVLVLSIEPVYFLCFAPIWLGIWFSLAAYCNLRLAKKAFARIVGSGEAGSDGKDN